MATNSKDDVLLRLKKVEGQIRGIQKMINDDKNCSDVIPQVCAARKALDKVGFMILTNKMQDCLKQSNDGIDTEKAMEEAMKLFLTLA